MIVEAIPRIVNRQVAKFAMLLFRERLREGGESHIVGVPIGLVP